MEFDADGNEIVDVSSLAVKGRMDSAIANVSPNLKSAAMFNAVWKEGLYRVFDDELGPANNGPPFTEATGLGWESSTEPKNKEDMIALAKKLNPVVGFWDPLGIVTEETSPETIGWFRHAEIKHGRVAMAGFVGYCLQANGFIFPWNLQGPIGGTGLTDKLPAISFQEIAAAGGPADQWDALPTAAKVQLILGVGFLEMWGETSIALEQDGQKHYVRGGKPGYYPPAAAHGRPLPAPGAAQPLGPLRLHQEDVGGAQGEGAPRGGQQRPPRDDRHLRRHLGVEGPHRPGPRLARDHAVHGRDHGALHGGGRGASRTSTRWSASSATSATRSKMRMSGCVHGFLW